MTGVALAPVAASARPQPPRARVRPARRLGRRCAGHGAPSQAGATTVYDDATRALPPRRASGRRVGRRPGRRPRASWASRPSPASAPGSTSPARSDSARTARRRGHRAARAAETARQDSSPSRRGRRRGCRREGVHVLLRGRQRQGHHPQRQGGLRLDRALQALHDGDDGAVPGPDVPADSIRLMARETGQ